MLPLCFIYIERLEQTELSHGRIETRVYELIAHPLELEANTILERWIGLKSVLRVYRKRVDKKSGSTSEETSYYSSSLTDLGRLKAVIRSHGLLRTTYITAWMCTWGKMLRIRHEGMLSR